MIKLTIGIKYSDKLPGANKHHRGKGGSREQPDRNKPTKFEGILPGPNKMPEISMIVDVLIVGITTFGVPFLP